jgi:hypothetical protein
MTYKKGNKNPNGGRKTKAYELEVTKLSLQAIEEKYGSLKDGFVALLNSKEPTLVKFVFEHCAGKPREKVDVTNTNEVEHVQIIQLPYNNRPVSEHSSN